LDNFEYAISSEESRRCLTNAHKQCAFALHCNNFFAVANETTSASKS
jgi:hypothetical protein